MSRKSAKSKSRGEGIRVFVGGSDGKTVVPMREVRAHPGGRNLSASELAAVRKFVAGHNAPAEAPRKRRKAG
jgi:hypothetical protein